MEHWMAAEAVADVEEDAGSGTAGGAGVRTVRQGTATACVAVPDARTRRTRRKRPVRAKTFAIRRISKEELRLGAILYPERNYWRPCSRGECKDAERPCPFVGCKFHLYLDVTATGSIKFNFPDLEVWEMRETCALDVAERTGGVTLEEAGEIMNLTRERIRQLEAVGIKKLVDAGLMEIVEQYCARREPAPADAEVAGGAGCGAACGGLGKRSAAG